ncbi:NIPSNAP family protein [Candidatus Pantoea formicae]|uniref:NIPSNAP family protein n=1 Tax=Candidatus Pantoea formicae TaxID=2608355 RepID=UPI00351D98CB
MSKLVEILQYRLKPGTGESFHQIMRDISVPLHYQQGIDVIAFGCSRHDADSYYLLRAFESEAQMQSVLEDFYASEAWQRGPREKVIERIEISLKSLLLLPKSAIDEIRKGFEVSEREYQL